jgi:hypothetical protein
MSRVIISSSLVVFVAAAAWVLMSEGSAEPPEARGAAATKAQDVASRAPLGTEHIGKDRGDPARGGEVDSLRRELRQVRAAMEKLESASAAAGVDVDAEGASNADEDPSWSSAEELEEAEFAWADAYSSQLDDILEGQGVDRAWADRTRSEALAAFGTLGSTVREATCGNTLCRLEIAHRDRSDHDALLAIVTQENPWESAAFYVPVERDGQPTTLMFLGRPGEELPVPESFGDPG